MNKLILATILPILLFMCAHPILAYSETFLTRDAIITGGGIITEGDGKDAIKITFAVNLLIKYYVNGEGQPVDEYGNVVDNGQLLFAESPKGNFHINFHNTGYNDDINKGKFTTTDINVVAIRPGSFQDPNDQNNHIFARIEADGKLNGENGWSILVRFSDFGAPGKVNRVNPDNLADAIRISLFDPSDVYVYGTSADFPWDQGRRTLLDGGNVTIYYQHKLAIR